VCGKQKTRISQYFPNDLVTPNLLPYLAWFFKIFPFIPCFLLPKVLPPIRNAFSHLSFPKPNGPNPHSYHRQQPAELLKAHHKTPCNPHIHPSLPPMRRRCTIVFMLFLLAPNDPGHASSNKTLQNEQTNNHGWWAVAGHVAPHCDPTWKLICHALLLAFQILPNENQWLVFHALYSWLVARKTKHHFIHF
jgi:hypothetical protein